MTKTKQTVPLSQIVDYATNEVHAEPNIKSFQTISKIASNQELKKMKKIIKNME